MAFGQTIQYVLANLKDTSNGLIRRPLIRSHAASAVRASAIPWPSTAASINMLARFRTGPGTGGAVTPAASNHLDQVLPVFEAQQRKFQQISRFGDAVTTRNKFWCADWEKPLGAKAHGVESGPTAVAMTNRKIHILACEVDVLDRCGDAEVDVGVGFGKPAESMHKPFGGKVR